MSKIDSNNHAKVAIVGVGAVGSAAAYAMMMDGAVDEICLIDRNKEKAEGEALDLQHGMQFTKSTKIFAGDSFELCKGADVVILCAGFAQKAGGETRADLLKRNVAVFKEIIPQITKYNKDCILLSVTNPLDALTYVAWKVSGFPECRVFGAGTVLDSARLRFLLGRHFKISPKDINAYILGEHGDTEFAWWSAANIGGIPLAQLPLYDKKRFDEIFQEVKNAAYTVINKKGCTAYSIALVIAKIVRAIVMDQCRVFTVSTVLHDYCGADDVCLSVPTIVRKSGICEQLPIQLTNEEQALFEKTYNKVKEALKSVS